MIATPRFGWLKAKEDKGVVGVEGSGKLHSVWYDIG